MCKAGGADKSRKQGKGNGGGVGRGTVEGGGGQQGGTRETEGKAGRQDRSRTAKPGEEGKALKPRQSPSPVVSGDGIMGNPGGNEKNPGKNNIFALLSLRG